MTRPSEGLVLSGQHSPLGKAFLASLGVEGPPINDCVDTGDEMLCLTDEQLHGDLEAAIFYYYQAGWAMLGALRAIAMWRFGGFGGVRRLLDHAAGFGRVTRFLVREMSPERVSIAEINQRAVEFQRREFGVHALASCHDPVQFEPGGHFDLIVVNSLFTHLPGPRFHAWLTRLVGLLSENGVLALSVHDETLLPEKEKMPSEGLLFFRTGEMPGLDSQEYGHTYVTPQFMQRAIEQSAPGCAWLRTPRGLCHFQDMYLVVKSPQVDFSGYVPDCGREGVLETATFDLDGVLVLTGWAVDHSPGDSVSSVEAIVEGTPVATTARLTIRDDVISHFGLARPVPCGWQLRMRIPEGFPQTTTVVVIVAVSGHGRRTVFHATTLASLLGNRGEQLERELVVGNREIERLTQRLAVRDREIADLHASLSWRVTAPARALLRWTRGY